MFADWLSFTVTLIVAVPFALATGAKLKLPVLFGLVYVTVGFGITAVSEEVTVSVSDCVSFVAPVPIPVRLTVCAEAFSAIVRLPGVFNVGASFTGFTVTVND